LDFIELIENKDFIFEFFIEGMGEFKLIMNEWLDTKLIKFHLFYLYFMKRSRNESGST